MFPPPQFRPADASKALFAKRAFGTKPDET